MFSKSNVPRFNYKSGVSPPPIGMNSGTSIANRGRGVTKTYTDMYRDKIMSSNNGSLINVDNRTGIPRPKSLCSEGGNNSRIPLKTRAQSEYRKSPSSDKESPETVLVKGSKSNETCPTTIGSNASFTNKRSSSKSPSKVPTPIRQTTLTSARLSSIKNVTALPKKRLNSYRALDFQKRDLEKQYHTKNRQFCNLKTELLKKQKYAIELYSAMITLKNRVMDAEGKELPLEEFRIVEYLDSKQRLSTGDNNILDLEEVKAVKRQLENSPAMLVELCRKIVDEKQDIIDNIFNEEGEWSQDELLKKIQLYKDENATLKDQIEEKLKTEEEKICGILKEWHSITKLQPDMNEEVRQELDIKLQETEHRLKQALADLQFEKSKKLKENDKVRELEKDIAKHKDKIQELTKNVEEERTKVFSQRERHSSFEQKLKAAKGKIRDVEMQKTEAESKMEKLNNTIKKMEEHWRSKEIFYENRQKEMQKHIKAHEGTIAKYEKDRTSVDARFDNIHDEYEDKEKMYKARLEDMAASLKHAEDTVAELREEKEKTDLNTDYLKAQLEKMDVCHHSIFKLCDNRKEMEVVDGEPAKRMKTDNEVALWTELEETKKLLRNAEYVVEKYNGERERFMEMIKMNYRENNDIDPLLVNKESEITELSIENKKIKQLNVQIQQELEQKNVEVKTLQAQIDIWKVQESKGYLDTEEQIEELINKLESEIQRNTKLQLKLTEAENNHLMAVKTLKECESLLNCRDYALNAMQEKYNRIVTENSSLRQYIKQLKENIHLMHEQDKFKDKELLRMSTARADKKEYMEQIERTVEKLENRLEESLHKRMDLQQYISDMEKKLRYTQTELAKCIKREESQQFISHCKNINISEFAKYHGMHPVAYNPCKSTICRMSSVNYNTNGNNVVQLLDASNTMFAVQEDIDNYNGTRNESEANYK